MADVQYSTLYPSLLPCALLKQRSCVGSKALLAGTRTHQYFDDKFSIKN